MPDPTPAAAPNAGGAPNNQTPAGQQSQQQTPANNPAPGNNQQQQQQQPQQPQLQPHNQLPGQQPPGQQPQFILSQEQFNQRWAEKMTTLETELGMPLKDVKAIIEKNKPKPAAGEQLSGADLRMAKMEALMTKGVPSRQIPVILRHFNISGKTREEIEASIQSLIDVKLLTIETPANPGNNQQNQQPQQQQQSPQQQAPPASNAQGAGHPPVQDPPGIKTFTESQIAAMSAQEYEANRPDIIKAMEKGAIKKG